MSVVLVVCAAVLGLAAMLVVARITLGPTMLDRAISFDVLVAITICGVAVDAAFRRTSENLPLLLVATLLGFVGSVSVARYSPGSDDVEAEAEADPEPEGRDEPQPEVEPGAGRRSEGEGR